MSDVLVSLRGISKSYPGVRALERVDFEVRAGEVHALCGQNGAGKSTLVRILGGVERPDEGSIEVGGRTVGPRTPLEALRAGVAVLHQETHLVPQLTVAENFFLGRELRRGLGLDWRVMRERAREQVRSLGVEVDVERPARELSAALAQLVGIARAVDLGSRVLVLDEPTSSLDRGEVARLFDLLGRLRERGLGTVFVAHSLDQIYAVSNRITVLRDGRRAGTFEARELSREALVERMLGRAAGGALAAGRAEPAKAEVVLEARGLGRARSIEPFDLALRRGEVVGLAGLLGSGRSELARLVAGVERATHGALRLDSAQIRWRSPRQALARGVAYCSEDRKLDGLFPNLSLADNVAIVVQRKLSRLGWLSRREHERIAKLFVASFGIVASSVEQPIGTLSGGNQQKALLARALACEPRVLVLDEPTRGIDVGSKRELEQCIEGFSERGMAVLFVSSALEEVLRLARRILVLRERRVTAHLDSAGISEARLRELLGRGGQGA